jgi:hypothetical protein
MLKWLLTLLLALVILSALMPMVRNRIALGRLPGDLRIPVRGRVYYVPFASTVLLSFLLWGIGRLL